MLNRRGMLLGVAGMLASGALALAADDKKEDAGKTEPNAEAVKAELKKLQGSWQAVSLEKDGEKAPDKVLKEARFDIKDNKMLEKGRDNNTELAIDPTTKPKSLNLKTENNAQSIDTKTGKIKKWKIKETLKGIYTLEGDTLTFCLASDPKADRPTKIESGKGVVIAVFKRQQP